MLEGFKINCYPLNRTIRVNIHLPNNYNDTGRFYPVVYFFDGQNVFNESDSYSGKSLSLESTINKLSENGKEAIYITIAAAMNPDKRLEEYKDTTLANFVVNSIHPYLASRYRFSNYIFSFGCSLSALNVLAVNESDTFKGGVLLSPEADIDMIKKLKLSNDIKKLLPSTNLVLDDNTIHDESAWKNKVYEALDYILL